jgi:hypothetical protein
MQMSQLWPLGMCGLILTGFYVGAYLVISSIAARLATLNIVTFTAVRFTRTFFFAQVRTGQQYLIRVRHSLGGSSAADKPHEASLLATLSNHSQPSFATTGLSVVMDL